MGLGDSSIESVDILLSNEIKFMSDEKKSIFRCWKKFFFLQNNTLLAVTVEKNYFFVNEVSFDESFSSKTIKEVKNMQFKINIFQVKR